MADATCAVDGCGRSGKIRRGWCEAHYRRWRVHGDPTVGGPVQPRNPDAECLIDDCGRPVVGRGWCNVHYRRWKRQGSPLRTTLLRADDKGRVCGTCSQYLPWSEYDGGAQTRNGKRTSCRTCSRVYKYGLTRITYEALLDAQDGRCRGCSRTFVKTPQVDHDRACCPRKTGTCGRCVRGLLCGPCNRALGMVEDNVATLHSLAEYLVEHR